MQKPKVLLVDDSEFDRMILRRALNKLDIPVGAVDEAEHALDAIDMLKVGAYDAIFLDINMPGETGFAVLRALRSVCQGSWPLVFMLSSSAHPRDIDMAFAECGTSYLEKSGSLSHLDRIVHAAITMASCVPARPCIHGPHPDLRLQ